MLFEKSLGIYIYIYIFAVYIPFFFMNRNIMCRQNKLLEESKGPSDNVILIILFVFFKIIYKKIYKNTYNII